MTERTAPDYHATMDRAAFLKASALAVGGASLRLTDAAPAWAAATRSARSAAARPRKGGVLATAFTSASLSDSLDPAVSLNILTAAVLGNVMEPLVAPDANFNPAPALAEKFGSDASGTTWTFQLRKAKFHNGNTLTSADVVYSLQRLLNPAVASPIYATLSPLLDPSGIVAVGPSTVKITLKQPSGLLPVLLSTRFALIIPNGATKTTGIGTGPFMVKSFAPGQNFSLSRWGGYWRHGLPYLAGVTGVVVTDQTTKITDLLSGPIDMGDPMDFTGVSEVLVSGTATISRQRNGGQFRICLMTNTAPYSNPFVIRAIKQALDRKQMVQLALQGYGSPAFDVPVPPSNPTFPTARQMPLSAHSYNVKEARALLRRAGYNGELNIGTVYCSTVTAGMVDLATVFQQQMEAIGITMNLQQLPPATYYSTVWKKQPACFSHNAATHPYNLLSQGWVGAPNETAFANSTFNADFARATAANKAKAQDAALQQAMAVVGATSGDIVPVFEDVLWPTKKAVNGLKFNGLSLVDWSQVWLG